MKKSEQINIKMDPRALLLVNEAARQSGLERADYARAVLVDVSRATLANAASRRDGDGQP